MSPSAISTHNLQLCPIQPEQYHIKTYPLELHTIRCLIMEKKERNKRRKRGDKSPGEGKRKEWGKHTLLVWIETVSQQSDFFILISFLF